MMKNETLSVTKIQKFCSHDGDGVRTTVFLKGCPLRCRWCHNPETQSAKTEFMFNSRLCIMCDRCAVACKNKVHSFSEEGHVIDRSACKGCMDCVSVCPTGALEAAATDMRPEEILEEVKKDKAFYGSKGGLTLSGGEPLFHGEKAIELLRMAKAEGINTAVETCGYFPEEYISKLVPIVDTFLWDIKDTDSERHKLMTGVYPDLIVSNLKKADSLGAKTVLRCIAVKTVNLNREHAEALAKLKSELKNCRGIDVLPYHVYGSSKAVALGRNDNGNKDWIPTDADIKEFKKYIRAYRPE